MSTPYHSGPHIPTSAGSRADEPRSIHAGQDDRLLRSRDAAAYLAISERKLWELSAGGQIPMVRCGRMIRYCVADLRGWVDLHRKGGRHGCC